MGARALARGTLRHHLAQLAEGMWTLFYPPRCGICLQSAQAAGCRFVCESCLGRLLAAEIPAVRYWQNSSEIRIAVRACECDLAAWFYEQGMMALVPRMKYQNRPSLAKIFAEVAAARLQEAHTRVLPSSEKAPVLVPVPLHSRRQRERGYNQSLLIARAFGEKWDVEVLPRALRRTHFTQPQAKLRAAERAKNVSQVFAPDRAEKVAGRTVLLVDDVITTGATVSACAQALLRAGAARVIAVALARTGRIH